LMAPQYGIAPIKHSTFVMGQVANVTAYGGDAPLIRTAITEAFNELRKVDALMSVFDENSELSRVNASASRTALHMDPYTIETVRAAMTHARRTGGAFDPTVEPLMRAWGFHAHRDTKPSDKEIAAALDATGVNN